MSKFVMLPEDFFQHEVFKEIEKGPLGAECEIIFLKLITRAIRFDGKILKEDGAIADIEYISKSIGEDKALLDKTLNILINNNLVSILEDGTICIPELYSLIAEEMDDGSME